MGNTPGKMSYEFKNKGCGVEKSVAASVEAVAAESLEKSVAEDLNVVDPVDAEEVLRAAAAAAAEVEAKAAEAEIEKLAKAEAEAKAKEKEKEKEKAKAEVKEDKSGRAEDSVVSKEDIDKSKPEVQV